MKTGATYLACALARAGSIYARYAATSKISQISTASQLNAMHQDYTTTVSGMLLPVTKYTNSHPSARGQAPCYMYFYEDLDVDLSFVYMDHAYPLQVTDRHIFFWPARATSNFTIKFDSKQRYFDTSLLSVYCGDLTDILGRNTIEQENAEFVKLGSFPERPDKTEHAGRVQLQSEGLNQESCKLQVHFPSKKVPQSLVLSSGNQLQVTPLEDERSFEITGLETLESTKFHDIWFDLKYADTSRIAYSYQIVAEVVGCKSYDYAKLEDSRGL